MECSSSGISSTDYVKSKISKLNSSTTNLSASNSYTFTGDWEKTSHPDAMVNLYADQVCTLRFQFSHDGATVHSTLTKLTTANINEFSTFVKGARYFRAVVTTDSLTTTTFTLQTQYGIFRAGNAPANLNLGLDADALNVRPTSFQDEVRIGRRPGISGWTKFGYREGLTASGGEQTIWAATGNYIPPTTAQTYTITYNSTTDGAGGSATGAVDLTFFDLDENGFPAVRSHTLGSSGNDTTSFSGLGINRITVSVTGAAKTNVNNIIITHTTSGNTMAVVPAPNVTGAYSGVTQQAIYHVGSNHVGIAKFIWYRVNKIIGGNPKVVLKGYVYNRNIDSYFEVYRDELDTQDNTTQTIEDPIGFALSAGDVLFFVADTDTNNTNVQLRFSLNDYQNS